MGARTEKACADHAPYISHVFIPIRHYNIRFDNTKRLIYYKNCPLALEILLTHLLSESFQK